ncbi:MAG: hypothetical protein SGARI_000852, partial [Bacillariaceae sp.]
MSAPGSNAAQGSATTVTTTYCKSYAAGDMDVYKDICQKHSKATTKVVVAGASGQGVEVHVARELDVHGAMESIMKQRIETMDDEILQSKIGLAKMTTE